MSTGAFNLTNQFLIAMPGMADDTFAGAVVYLCEHTENGALGLVINKPIDITLKNLFDKVELPLDSPTLGQQPVFLAGRYRPSAALCCTMAVPARAAPTPRR